MDPSQSRGRTSAGSASACAKRAVARARSAARGRRGTGLTAFSLLVEHAGSFTSENILATAVSVLRDDAMLYRRAKVLVKPAYGKTYALVESND